MSTTIDSSPTPTGEVQGPRRKRLGLTRFRARRADYPHTRESVALILLAIAITAYLGVLVAQYERGRSLLLDQRARAGRAHATLAKSRSALSWTDAEIDRTREQVLGTRERSARRVRERTLLRAGLSETRDRLAEAGSELGLTETAVFIVGLHQTAISDCLAGVDRATGAISSGDDNAAVSALRAAAPACATALEAAAGTRFPFDFADPYVIDVGGTYYGYSTNSGVGDVQVIRSRDLMSWEVVGNALPALPAWAAPNRTWAPAVLHVNDTFVVYYTAEDRQSGRQCISRAVGTSPSGPFVDDSSAALMCQLDHGGSIDPSPVIDGGGTPWLLWKSEGLGSDPSIVWSQRLSADGLSLTGLSSQLIRADQPWEHGVVEGPSMLSDAGRWYLFYSAADWKTRQYAIGYALCDGPAGPCHKPTSAPVVASDGRIAGPGGPELFRDPSGSTWIAFHAYTEPDVGYPSSRTLHLLRVRFVAGEPVFEAGT